MLTFIFARNSEFGNSGTCTAGVRECELPSPFATTIEQTGPRLDVLLIDELGYLNLKPEQSNIFFKLMEERYRQHSTIITTNLVYDEWPNFLGSRADGGSVAQPPAALLPHGAH